MKQMLPLFDNNIFYKDNYLDNYIENEENDYLSINKENNINNYNIPFLNDNLNTSFSSLSIPFPKPFEKLEKLKNVNLNNEKVEEKTHYGRKTKQSNELGIHTKYFKDNIFIKIKNILFSALREWGNSIIFQIYDGNIGVGRFIKILKKINQKQIKDCKGDKKLLNKNLEEILSDDISGRYSNYDRNHNKILIQKLLNEEDLEKRKKFKKFFSLNFLDCLMHFRGDKFYEELQGLKTLDSVISKFDDDKDYKELFTYYVFHFEEIIMKKRSRKKYKKSKKN